ncbi:MAG TPA: polyprenyl diphosphate synthase [Thermodesulfobacteriota bacterium]|nr:polyprenyl diphosphate synthase [Thermodesulfobacteriota bacterium]
MRRLLYRLYEARLQAQVARGEMPRHIGLILDGNRRYARQQGLRTIVEGHERGARKLEEVLGWLEALDIRMVTIWILSTENLSRDPEELNGLLTLIESKMRQIARDPRVHERRMRLRAIGQIERLPPSTREAIREAEAATRDYDAFFLNVAVGYGGRQEIVDAIKGLLRERAARGESLAEITERLSPEDIERHLYTYDLPDPDLIIRTSGEVRLSGFLLWQSAYSEYYFCDAYWPEFRRIDLLRAIRSYQQRQRRFGR